MAWRQYGDVTACDGTEDAPECEQPIVERRVRPVELRFVVTNRLLSAPVGHIDDADRVLLIPLREHPPVIG
jgi:hypothetical protein